MEITLKFTASDYRTIEYYLRQRYKSKAKLPLLAKLAIRTEVALEAKKKLAEVDILIDGGGLT